MNQITIQQDPNTKVEIEKITAKIAMVDGYIKSSGFYPDLDITISNPKLVTLITETPKAVSPSVPTVQIQNLEDIITRTSVLKNIKLHLKIENLTADINEPFSKLAALRNTNLQMSFQSLQSPIYLNLSSSVKSEKLPIWIPIELASQWQLRQGVLTLSQSDLKILAITTRSRGQLDLSKKKIAFQILAQAPALEKIPIPSHLNLPFNSWKGSLDSKINITGTFEQPNNFFINLLKDYNLNFSIYIPYKISLN